MIIWQDRNMSKCFMWTYMCILWLINWRWRELVADRKKMEGHCSTGQSPQWAVVPMEKDDDEVVVFNSPHIFLSAAVYRLLLFVASWCHAFACNTCNYLHVNFKTTNFSLLQDYKSYNTVLSTLWLETLHTENKSFITLADTKVTLCSRNLI